MGIDEAGRGPVCGPMTYGICYSPIGGRKRLEGIGFMDSKQLSEEVREKLFKKIKEADDFIGWNVAVLSPQDISGHMMGRINYNLNAMSHDCAISMVHRVIEQGARVLSVHSHCNPPGVPSILCRPFELPPKRSLLSQRAA
jgi:ribonuclease H2 subunit A